MQQQANSREEYSLSILPNNSKPATKKVLSILLRLKTYRFEFDWENNTRVKLNDEISFPNILNMEEYLIDPNLAKQLDKEKKANESGEEKADTSPESSVMRIFNLLISGSGTHKLFV